MRGIDSIAKATTPRCASRSIPSASVSGCRNPTSTWPSRSRPVSSAVGFCTFTTASTSPHGSSTSRAPASSYAASGKDAASPARRSTSTSKPTGTSLPTSSGTSATRRSPATVSLGTPIRMSRDAIASARGRSGVEFDAVPGRLAEIAETFFRPAVNDLVPYEPGKPVEEVQRELGLERVVKLASNEGPYGPFPAAREAIERSVADLNRYPDGGAYRLRAALAERYDLRFEEVAVGAGSDGLVDCLSLATLDPGEEIVCGWPSFPSYVIDARKLGAVPRTVPLRDGRYDLEAMLEAVGPRTKIVYVCLPNNPTGTTNTRVELDAYFDRVPGHVVTVLDQAYAEYIDDPDYPDGIEEYFKRGRRIVVVRTFSKIFGLAGLRIGWGVAAADIVTAVGKVRRAFDITTPAQAAA